MSRHYFFFFFQAEDGIRDLTVTGVQTCALPICSGPRAAPPRCRVRSCAGSGTAPRTHPVRCSRRYPGYSPWWMSSRSRSEEHTSELQSQSNLVCRLLLEKKKKSRYDRFESQSE